MGAHDPDGGRSPGSRTGARPRRPWLITAVAVALLALAVPVGLAWNPTTSVARAAVGSTSVAAHSDPGADPQMQRWTAGRGPHEVALNNALALVLARAKVGPRLVRQPCTIVKAETHAMLAMAKAPNARVDQLSRAGLSDLSAGAQACLQGDTATALARIRAGLAARQEVRNDLDETLEGEG